MRQVGRIQALEGQLGLVRELRLELETPSARLAAAAELGALREELLAEGEAWQDEDFLARMRRAAEEARGLAGLPPALGAGSRVPAGPAYLAEFGGCHVWPGDAEGPLAWYRSQGTDYVVIQHVGPRFRIPLLKETRRDLEREARLVLRATPMARDGGESAGLDIRYQKPVLKKPFFVHLWQARSMGPTLEVYALD